MTEAIEKGKLKETRKFAPEDDNVVTEPAMIREAKGSSSTKSQQKPRM